jgi:hypothetical protein
VVFDTDWRWLALVLALFSICLGPDLPGSGPSPPWALLLCARWCYTFCPFAHFDCVFLDNQTCALQNI